MKIKRNMSPWEHYIISDMFNDDILDVLNSVPLSKYYSEYTQQDAEDRNYDQKNVMYHNVENNSVAEYFTNIETSNILQNTFNIDLRLRGVRLVLAEIVGARDEWVHVDSDDKLLSLVIYLGDKTLPSRGTWIYETNQKLYKKLDHIPNTGLMFKPTHSTWHSLPVWNDTNSTRKALIINYIDIPTPLQLLQNRELKIPENVYRVSM